ncbi:MAG: SDR family NAD(P)-dependent oxidoreductase [Gammaproteobacteria bacterium]|nr:SDR family NAD(P)-dependent oxidoreductase [Gammaproteobacteria bacterium]
MSTALQLMDKLAIVTGAANERGIGFAAARALGEQGARVLITDIKASEEKLYRRRDSLRDSGVECDAACCNVSDPLSVDDLLASIIERHQGIDILFNNAGIGTIKKFEETSLAEFEANMRVNFFGTVIMTQAVVPLMKANGGAIINNASVGGIYADPYFSAYNSSKFAVVGFTKSLAGELGEYGIRLNAICPGMTDTDMADGMPRFFADLHETDIETAREALRGEIALGRAAQPREVAELVAYLAGPGASYITGAAIPVTGGFPKSL